MKIIIPKENSNFRKSIAPGSGIVMLSTDNKTEFAEIYYEGNLYDSYNLRVYDERIKCAAGRAHHKYPTIAYTILFKADIQDFVIVGRCNPENDYQIEFFSAQSNIINEWIST